MIERFEPVGGGLDGVLFEDIISVENLLAAWQGFVRGKRNKPDVQVFASTLIDNILQLNADLANKTYRHGGYYQFNISDPKPRSISKASVRDRLVHHAVYRILYPFFDQTFICDSYSCRLDKGTHKAVNRFRSMFLDVSDYNRKTCWVLKLDIRKFFASIDHEILSNILAQYISDKNILWLVTNIIDSFGIDRHAALAMVNKFDHCEEGMTKQSNPKGLPLGNLTSQLFVNIYMDKFDQFAKHNLKTRYYIRYADDFVVLSRNYEELTSILSRMEVFLKNELRLNLHRDKVILKTFASGIDFLGWVNFPKARVLRTATKRRMMKRIRLNPKNSTLQSYLGLIKHGNSFKIQQEIRNR